MNPSQAIGIGDLLTRPKAFSLVDHTGVAVGPRMVIQNTPEKGEHLATLPEFSAGQPITVHRTGADPKAVMARARRVLANPKRQHLLLRNCQHTAHEIICGVAKSPQYQKNTVRSWVSYHGPRSRRFRQAEWPSRKRMLPPAGCLPFM